MGVGTPSPGMVSCGQEPGQSPSDLTTLDTGATGWSTASELLSPTRNNVDFRHSLIHVEAAYAKNGEARSVPMTAVLTETLKAIRINAAHTAPVFRTRAGQSD